MDRDLAFILGGFALSILLLICAVMFASNVYGSYQCASYERITGKKTMWQTLDICYIQTADGWQRWDEYTKRAVASEGLKRSPR
jgi:hypothetical protein